MIKENLSELAPTGYQEPSPGARPNRADQRTTTDSISRPQELSLKLIDEDPHQPRTEDNPGFSIESLEELAVTIQQRGVKTPISVRRHNKQPGRFIINHGARRVRASKLANRVTIPAFIDDDYSESDQVIENLQRNELTAREIADFIGRKLSKGATKKEIANGLGKSPAFVSQHVTLLDLPDPISEAYNTGRVRDVTVVNELVTAFKKHPKDVVAWLSDDSQELTRGAVRLLREFLENRYSNENDGGEHRVIFVGNPADATGIDTWSTTHKKRQARPSQLRRTIVQVRHGDRSARLILNRRPPAEGWVWLKYEDDGQELPADLAQVRLVRLTEG